MTRDTFHAAMRTLRVNPDDESLRLVTADLIEDLSPEPGDFAAAQDLRQGKIPVAHLDVAAINALYGCTFLPGSLPKRFVQSLHYRIPLLEDVLTPKQYRYLWDLAYRYRRQIRDPKVNEEALAVWRARQGHGVVVIDPELPFDDEV